MHALVTGASGHLGANLVRELISRGWNVRALVHRDTRAIEGLDVEKVHGDILEPESLKKALSGIDCVFHLAARISVSARDHEKVERMNIDGVGNIVNACIEAGIKRLVHTSSFHALQQKPLNVPLDEFRPLFDAGRYPPYNYSKAEGERIVRSAARRGLDAVIIHPTGIIGPFDYTPSHFGATLVMIAGGQFPAAIDAGLDWVDARDVASGMVSACEKGEQGASYIMGGHWISIKEVFRQASEFAGRKCPGLTLPLWLAGAAAPCVTAFDRLRGRRPLFTTISTKELNSNPNVSHEKASRELGYQPRPFDETLNDTLKWFEANGYLNRVRKSK